MLHDLVHWSNIPRSTKPNSLVHSCNYPNPNPKTVFINCLYLGVKMMVPQRIRMESQSHSTQKHNPCTLVSKALWYKTFKKLDCMLPDLRPLQNVPNHSICYRLKCALKCWITEFIMPSIMPISTDLTINAPFTKKWNKKKSTFFLSSWNFTWCFGSQLNF